jgi:hypothetical protein
MTLSFFEADACSYPDVISLAADSLWTRLLEADWRLAAKIQVDVVTGCWLWTGAANKPQGYGRLSRGSHLQYAHRWTYELLVGPIPTGLFLDPSCQRPPCVNPLHLDPVTPAVNSQRSAAVRPSPTHCNEGHELERRPNGDRFCRVCRNRYARDWYRNNRSRSGRWPRTDSTAVVPDGAR